MLLMNKENCALKLVDEVIVFSILPAIVGDTVITLALIVMSCRVIGVFIQSTSSNSLKYEQTR